MAKTVAGVELYNNTAKLVEFSKKLFENEVYGEKLWLEWDSTTTQHCNTKQTMKLMTSKPVEFSKKTVLK